MTEHLSDDHNIILGWYNLQPVITIAKRPKDEPQDQLLEELAPFIKRKTPLRVKQVILAKASWENFINVTTVLRMMVRRYHAYSERAPIWLREFARCVAKAGDRSTETRNPCRSKSRPSWRSYIIIFLISWQDVVLNEYAGKTDPLEILFLTEMCLEYPDHVKDELLKVRLQAEVYLKASYYI